jgi:hypothetical protein
MLESLPTKGRNRMKIITTPEREIRATGRFESCA